jgi:uncharacterized repeat protein (TIGR04042 family)
MPEVWFKVRWPDATTTRCYSPSTIVRNYFVPGDAYPLREFVSRSRDAMNAASERVRQTYGYACSSAAAQLDEIERTATRFSTDPDAHVTVEGFDEG